MSIWSIGYWNGFYTRPYWLRVLIDCTSSLIRLSERFRFRFTKRPREIHEKTESGVSASVPLSCIGRRLGSDSSFSVWIRVGFFLPFQCSGNNLHDHEPTTTTTQRPPHVSPIPIPSSEWEVSQASQPPEAKAKHITCLHSPLPLCFPSSHSNSFVCT